MAAPYRTFFLTVGFFATITTATQAQGPAVEPAALAAVNAARGGEWPRAYAEASQSKDLVVQKAVRWLMLFAAVLIGAFGIIAFTFRRLDVSQDLLYLIGGLFGYAFLAGVAAAIVVAQVRRRRRERRG